MTNPVYAITNEGKVKSVKEYVALPNKKDASDQIAIDVAAFELINGPVKTMPIIVRNEQDLKVTQGVSPSMKTRKLRQQRSDVSRLRHLTEKERG